MAFHLESYLEHAGPLSLEGIDFDRARHWPLDEDMLRALAYFTDVEGHTIMWVRDLLNTGIRHDPRVTTFISCWAYQELFHSRAIDKFLRAYGAPTGEERLHEVRSNIRVLKERFEAVGSWLIGIHPGVQKATYYSWGAAAEYTTLTGYALLARRTNNPVLREVLLRIGKDERKHFAFYFNEAKEALKHSELVRQCTYWLLDWLWTPVGSGIKPQAEVDFLTRYLADTDGGRGREALLDIDRTIARLPGLHRFAKMRKVMEGLGLLDQRPAS
ncbi:MAG: hypothetical protein RMK29_01965 [Myxococcales bacterium]|nr:hypothetical protein [Myxococcota bacterium]MDW8280447.1 hypothetical protein [Myxococcales bacterium]